MLAAGRSGCDRVVTLFEHSLLRDAARGFSALPHCHAEGAGKSATSSEQTLPAAEVDGRTNRSISTETSLRAEPDGSGEPATSLRPVGRRHYKGGSFAKGSNERGRGKSATSSRPREPCEGNLAREGKGTNPTSTEQNRTELGKGTKQAVRGKGPRDYGGGQERMSRRAG